MKNSAKGLIEVLLKNKPFYLGLAMIFVILYHFYNVSISWHSYMKFLIPGFIGVDWFVFFSGYSLCFSWKKNRPCVFFAHRFWRIMPMYVVFSTLATFIFLYKGGEVNAFDVFCNLTTLNYYGIGGFFIDWYIPAIILFYMFFPLLFNFNRSNYGSIVVAVFCGAILYFTKLKWWYDVAIARIPIFCLGILFFFDQSEHKTTSIISSFVFLALFMIGVLLGLRGCFLTDMICPLTMLVVSSLLIKWPIILTSRVGKIIEFIGEHSLEFYVGNVLACMIIHTLSNNQWSILLWYVVLNIVVSWLMIIINKGVKMGLAKSNIIKVQ